MSFHEKAWSLANNIERGASADLSAKGADALRAALRRDRREAIATACLASIAAVMEEHAGREDESDFWTFPGAPSIDYEEAAAKQAVKFADELIAHLDASEK